MADCVLVRCWDSQWNRVGVSAKSRYMVCGENSFSFLCKVTKSASHCVAGIHATPSRMVDVMEPPRFAQPRAARISSAEYRALTARGTCPSGSGRGLATYLGRSAP